MIIGGSQNHFQAIVWSLKTKKAPQMLQLAEFFSRNKGPGLEVIKLEFILKLRVKRYDWLLVDTCPQAANHYALF